MKFAMTDSEIIKSYKSAMNYKEQVKIIAELNDVPVQDMAQKMRDLGLDVDMRWYAQAPKGKPAKKEVKANVSDNDEIQRLKAELEQQKELVGGLNETVMMLKVKADYADKYRKIIMILMEE